MTPAGDAPARPLRIALAQYAPRIGDPAHNVREAVAWARRAADSGAALAVLPELASSGYTFASAEEADRLAEVPGDGPVTSALAAVASTSGMHVVVGVDERGRDGARHNSAVLVGPGGVIATYRKLHLFNDEKSWFTPGADLPIVDLPWGRLGMIVCFDIWFPEPARALALAGADVVACPTNWVSSFKRRVYDERGWCQGDYMAVARAAENGLVVACADRVGEERGLRFLGASIVVDADGWPAAGPASNVDEALVVADVDLAGVERARSRTPRNHLLDDRRASYATTRVTPRAGAGSAAVP